MPEAPVGSSDWLTVASKYCPSAVLNDAYSLDRFVWRVSALFISTSLYTVFELLPVYTVVRRSWMLAFLPVVVILMAEPAASGVRLVTAPSVVLKERNCPDVSCNMILVWL
ncbi:hypothetical protein D3C86_1970860 [compost metagenome]